MTKYIKSLFYATIVDEAHLCSYPQHQSAIISWSQRPFYLFQIFLGPSETASFVLRYNHEDSLGIYQDGYEGSALWWSYYILKFWSSLVCHLSRLIG